MNFLILSILLGFTNFMRIQVHCECCDYGYQSCLANEVSGEEKATCDSFEKESLIRLRLNKAKYELMMLTELLCMLLADVSETKHRMLWHIEWIGILRSSPIISDFHSKKSKSFCLWGVKVRYLIDEIADLKDEIRTAKELVGSLQSELSALIS